jgi:hypothetical protein
MIGPIIGLGLVLLCVVMAMLHILKLEKTKPGSNNATYHKKHVVGWAIGGLICCGYLWIIL